VNTRYEILDWFGLSFRVIALRSVLMYYAIEIDSSLFFWDVLNVDVPSLFIVGEPPHRV
jgi:hypothetical protein